MDEQRVSSSSILFKVPGCTTSSLGSMLCHDSEKGVSISNHTLNIITILRSMRVTPLGVRLRVIVNETPLNLEKTTSSVLSVILINL